MRGFGDSDALITIRRHSDSEMWEQGFLDLPSFHIMATLTMGSMTTNSSLRVMWSLYPCMGAKRRLMQW